MATRFHSHVLGSAQTGSTGLASTAATPINTVGASLLVAAVAGVKSQGFTSADFTDNCNNSWQVWPQGSKSASLFTILTILYCANPVTTPTHTFQYSGASAVNPSIALVNFAGTAATPLDQQSYVTSGTSSSPYQATVPTVTTSVGGEAAAAFVATNQASTVVNSFSNMTLLDQVPSVASTHYGIASAYAILPNTPAATPIGTVVNQSLTAQYDVAELVTFKPLITGLDPSMLL